MLSKKLEQDGGMMNQFKTDQEEFWAGEFGDEYVDRNRSARQLAGNVALFARIFRSVRGVKTTIEFGANIGLNLAAIRELLPDAELSAVEINQKAVEELSKMDRLTIYPLSLLDFSPARTYDLVLIKGVLIHMNPDVLTHVYDRLYRSSGRYICIAEYYNPSPVSIPYRGHDDRLFKRDFAGEMLDRYSDLRLVDYGFVYRRDPMFPQDDITWFLLEK